MATPDDPAHLTPSPGRRTHRWLLWGLLSFAALLASAGSCGTEEGSPQGDADGSVEDAGDEAAAAEAAGSSEDAETDSANDATTTPSAADSMLPAVPSAERTAVTDAKILNREAPIPPQCYTRTEGVHNPCFVCHQVYDRGAEDRLNQLDDGYLQGEYGFSDVGLTNHWTNLFVDRTAWLAEVSDAQIRQYVDMDNYSDLAGRLQAEGWQGFIPDLEGYENGAAAFDEDGLAKDGSGWVAYDYKPFPGTFWPTNGATDDVLVRLPAAFRRKAGVFDRDVYFTNLTLVELNIKQLPRASIWPVDEAALGVDIDGDGSLGTATEVAMRGQYVGDAGDIAVEFQQFPTGSELMHSVRYLGVDDEGSIYLPRRMKELRYMEKVNTLSRSVINARYAKERSEKLQGALPNFLNRGDRGFDNGLGWYVRGFIEDYDGSLRPQSFEEGMFCMGCHTNISSTFDSTFSMARKVTGAEGWGFIDLHGMRDAPSVSEAGNEILHYLERAGGGSEFRENQEMRERWFDANGDIDATKVTGAEDVAELLLPSARRALDLDKAYTHIVRHQSFIMGRDATAIPAENVYREIDRDSTPLADEFRVFGWDSRLDWSQ